VDEMILKHIRTLPVELVAAALAKELRTVEPMARSGYSYEDKERGYVVRIEVTKK
jgi:hypothetical protein